MVIICVLTSFSSYCEDSLIIQAIKKKQEIVRLLRKIATLEFMIQDFEADGELESHLFASPSGNFEATASSPLLEKGTRIYKINIRNGNIIRAINEYKALDSKCFSKASNSRNSVLAVTAIRDIEKFSKRMVNNSFVKDLESKIDEFQVLLDLIEVDGVSSNRIDKLISWATKTVIKKVLLETSYGFKCKTGAFGDDANGIFLTKNKAKIMREHEMEYSEFMFAIY